MSRRMTVLDALSRLKSKKPSIRSDRDFERLLSTPDMSWLRSHCPESCADAILALYERIPDNQKFHTGFYLLDGPFAYRLSYKYPHKYAEFFTKIVGFMPIEKGDFFSVAKPIPGCNNCWIVFPKNISPLPPIIFKKDGLHSTSYPVNEELRNIMSVDAVNTVNDIIEAHYNAESAKVPGNSTFVPA